MILQVNHSMRAGFALEMSLYSFDLSFDFVTVHYLIVLAQVMSLCFNSTLLATACFNYDYYY